MLCRLNPTIHSRFSSHIDLKVYIITFISLGPAMVRIIEVPLATLLLDSKMDLARKLNITHELFALVLYRILPATATR